MIHWLSFFTVCFLGLGQLMAQSHHVTYYQRSDGLPANLTKTTIQDDQGFIWVSTDVGLARFDGHRFVSVLKELPSPYVKSFSKLRNGRILATTDGGLVTLKPDNLAVGIENFLLSTDTSAGFAMRYPKTAFEACNGDLWIPQDTSLLRMRDGQFRSYPFHTSPVNFLRSIEVWEQGCEQILAALPTGALIFFDKEKEDFSELTVASNGHPLVKAMQRGAIQIHAVMPLNDGKSAVLSTNEGAVLVNIDLGKRQFSIENWGLSQTAVSHVAQTKSGQVYICTFNNGVFWANDLNDLPNATPIRGLPFHVTNYAYPDAEGNVWINGDGGLALLQPQFFTTIPVPQGKRIIHYFIGEDEEAYCIDIDRNLYRLVGKHNQWQWKLVVPKLSMPSSDISFSIQMRVAIANNAFYTLNNATPTIYTSQGTRPIALPNPVLQYFTFNYDRKGNLWMGNRSDKSSEVYLREPNGQFSVFTHEEDGKTLPLLPCIDRTTGNVYFAVPNNKKTYLLRYNPDNQQLENLSAPIPKAIFANKLDPFFIHSVAEDKYGTLWLCTFEGLFKIENGVFSEVKLGAEFARQPVKYFLPDNTGGAWIALNVGLLYYRDGEVHEFSESDGLATSNILHEGLKLDDQGRLWVATSAGIAYSQHSALEISATPKPIITQLKVNGKVTSCNQKTLEAPYNSFFEVSFVSPTYPSEKVLYRYRLNHREDVSWSAPSLSPQLLLPQLEEGDYQLEIQAKQQGNYEWSAPVQVIFSIQQLWYRTWWGILCLILASSALLAVVAVAYSARLRRQKIYLEKLVTQRTEEISQQKEEISQQRDNLKDLNDELGQTIALVNRQKEQIEAKNQNITDSINYASRIQAAMLPSEELMRDLLPEHFVLYRPRDIVSGDFYWCNRLEDGRVILAVGDCTGHGVPGAFMSMIGAVLLEQLIMVKGEHKPNCILEDLSNAVKKALHQHETINQDGMDMAICLIDKKAKKLHFSGAKNPIVYIQNGEVHRIKGVPAPIGGESNRYDSCYVPHVIDISEPTVFYLFSDGYQDQFGGEQGKKFMSAKFRDLLEQIHTLPMHVQKKKLQETFVEWMLADGRAYAQVDDVLVVGVRV